MENVLSDEGQVALKQNAGPTGPTKVNEKRKVVSAMYKAWSSWDMNELCEEYGLTIADIDFATIEVKWNQLSFRTTSGDCFEDIAPNACDDINDTGFVKHAAQIEIEEW